jgi:hypothetical protein
MVLASNYIYAFGNSISIASKSVLSNVTYVSILKIGGASLLANWTAAEWNCRL